MLDGKRLGKYNLVVEEKPRRFFDQSSFWLGVGDSALMTGVFSKGRSHIPGWLDAFYFQNRGIDLKEDGLEEELFRMVGGLVPAGGHLMVAYGTKYGSTAEETFRGLNFQFPEEATPLGYLLFRAGCGVNFKDWYISEGGLEGPTKLQGFKAVDKAHARVRASERIEVLEKFLRKRFLEHGPIEEAARERAKAVLRELKALVG